MQQIPSRLKSWKCNKQFETIENSMDSRYLKTSKAKSTSKDIKEHNEKVESTQWHIHNDDEVFGHETWVMMHNR